MNEKMIKNQKLDLSKISYLKVSSPSKTINFLTNMPKEVTIDNFFITIETIDECFIHFPVQTTTIIYKKKEE